MKKGWWYLLPYLALHAFGKSQRIWPNHKKDLDRAAIRWILGGEIKTKETACMCPLTQTETDNSHLCLSRFNFGLKKTKQIWNGNSALLWPVHNRRTVFECKHSGNAGDHKFITSNWCRALICYRTANTVKESDSEPQEPDCLQSIGHNKTECKQSQPTGTPIADNRKPTEES